MGPSVRTELEWHLGLDLKVGTRLRKDFRDEMCDSGLGIPQTTKRQKVRFRM